MMLRVMYHDNTFDMVKAAHLEDLIVSGKILKFKRSDGWVVIGRDPLRGSGTRPYNGPERRVAHYAT